jgi:hypothetical protein
LKLLNQPLTKRAECAPASAGEADGSPENGVAIFWPFPHVFAGIGLPEREPERKEVVCTEREPLVRT